MVRKLPLLLALSLLALPGCLYSKVRIPWDTDLSVTQLGDKVGKSKAYSVLNLVSWGDAGTRAAAEEAGITTLRHMDREVMVILFFLYAETTTIVYGD